MLQRASETQQLQNATRHLTSATKSNNKCNPNATVVKSVKNLFSTKQASRKSIQINKQSDQLINAKTQRELMKVLRKQGTRNSQGETVTLTKVASVTIPQRPPPSLKVIAGGKHPSIKHIQREKILDLEMVEMLSK